jgi:AcrR family transcriptional regulator
MTQQRSEETRASILDSAVRLFAISGYNETTVDAICGAAGVSKGAFYHHFPSKQAIFIALLEGWLQTIDAGINALRKPTVPETFVQMTEILPAIFASADERLPMFLEFWTQASRNEEIWKATIAPYRHYRDHFTQLIKDGIAEGSLKPVDPVAAAEVVLSMAVGLFLQGVLDPKGADWANIARQSIGILLSGLAK